jgi:hypothetical protein
MARHALLDLGEPIAVGVEPVEVAVEDDHRSLRAGEAFDAIERREIAVEPADDIEHAGGEFRRAIEHRVRVAIVGGAHAARAPARAVMLGGFRCEGGCAPSRIERRRHSAACLSAPPQLDPWPAVQP